MQTRLADFIRDTPDGRTADAILRKCVHCGFCTATCPTYQLLGDELDSPRGRIYLVKQLLEGAPVTARTQTHLDRCLTCRACETTCPSGVRYGRLVDIGRRLVDERVSRPITERIKRWALLAVIPHRARFAPCSPWDVSCARCFPAHSRARFRHANRPAAGRCRATRGGCSRWAAARKRRLHPESMQRPPGSSTGSESAMCRRPPPDAAQRPASTSELGTPRTR